MDRVDDILNELYQPYKERLKKNFEEGFQYLCENGDKYTTRGKLAEAGYDFFTINWLETNSSYEYFLTMS